LFTEPSFVEGMAHVVDIGGNFAKYNESKTPSEADYKAIQLDWLCVGDDLVSAVNIVKKEIKK